MSQTSTRRPIRLGAYLSGSGVQGDSWRHPDADVDAFRDFSRYQAYAQTLERGCFDALFLFDNVVAPADADSVARGTHTARWDPLVLLSALAVVTQHIGLIASVSTTYNEPFNVARRFASLDQLSGGRAGWNVVTSTGGGENFNLDGHVDHAQRYRRAHEFVDVVTGLWDSWADDAFVLDKDSGRFADPAKLRTLDHRGEFFRVKGPLNHARPPQGWPVLAQAGSSEDGKDLAARIGEFLYTAEPDLAHARAFYADVKGRAARLGRDPAHLHILPGVMPVIGRSRAEAEDKYGQLLASRDADVTLKALSSYASLGLDLGGLAMDARVPLPAVVPATNSHKSRQQILVDWIRTHQPTLQQLYTHFSAGGHRMLVGTAADIADDFEQWVDGRAADGFNIMFSSAPGGLNDFVEWVVPELQRRGRLRQRYEHRTLRQNLGLPARPNRHFGSPAQTGPLAMA
ncbi:MAG: LLM class flavin-dependent oxidoreductase [Burkholderiaceae bacterium]|nr:LLM class flavin-dependent oxidoreductase [Burkholderiaceae bacterium]